MHKLSYSAALMLALSLAACSTPREHADSAQFKADMAQAKAEYKADKRHCDRDLRGAREEACEDQAKADRLQAEANARASRGY